MRTHRSRRDGCAARTASSTRSSPCPTGPITPTTRSRSSRPAGSTRSTSRCGRPASWCRKDFASRCRCAAPTTSIRASPAPASARSPTTIPATGRRRCSAASSHCMPDRSARRICCCRSSPRSKRDAMSYREVSEVRDGMRIDWDMPITANDGLVLRCDVFRPVKPGRYPVILSYGPYGKWLHFADGYATAWKRMEEKHPDVMAGSTNKYASWEVCDPEKWVPDGYVCVRVDSRGCGRSPGYVEHWSPREARDLFECIEWAGREPWSNGKVGLSGISYYAINQWKVASMRPKHLAAICVWEGFADFYRELSHNGGIYNTFAQNWYDMQVKTVQYGLGSKGHRSRMNGDWVSGPETLTAEQMGANRYDLGKAYFAHPLHDDFYEAMLPDWSKVKVPLLSAANWGGQPLHPRGNFEGFFRAASKQKWLEVHGIEHWTHYYTDYGVALQKRFFGCFLKGEKNGWDKQPRVQLNIRHPGEKFVIRHEDNWPLPSTRWTKFRLIADGHKLSTEVPRSSAAVAFEAQSDGVTFLTEPMREATEITGPVAAKLHISSSTEDADIFLVLRVISPDMKEIVFQGALDPHTPI